LLAIDASSFEVARSSATIRNSPGLPFQRYRHRLAEGNSKEKVKVKKFGDGS